MAGLIIGTSSSGLPVDIVELILQGVAQGAVMFEAAVKSLPGWMQLLLGGIVVVRIIETLCRRRSRRPAHT